MLFLLICRIRHDLIDGLYSGATAATSLIALAFQLGKPRESGQRKPLMQRVSQSTRLQQRLVCVWASFCTESPVYVPLVNQPIALADYAICCEVPAAINALLVFHAGLTVIVDGHPVQFPTTLTRSSVNGCVQSTGRVNFRHQSTDTTGNVLLVATRNQAAISVEEHAPMENVIDGHPMPPLSLMRFCHAHIDPLPLETVQADGPAVIDPMKVSV